MGLLTFVTRMGEKRRDPGISDPGISDAGPKAGVLCDRGLVPPG
jgi:hypothetical protein